MTDQTLTQNPNRITNPEPGTRPGLDPKTGLQYRVPMTQTDQTRRGDQTMTDQTRTQTLTLTGAEPGVWVRLGIGPNWDPMTRDPVPDSFPHTLTLGETLTLTHGDIVHMVHERNSDGSPVRWRVSGRVQTWVRDPNRVRVPVKYGLYSHGAIDRDIIESQIMTLDPDHALILGSLDPVPAPF